MNDTVRQDVPSWKFTLDGIEPANDLAWEIQADIDQLSHAA